jgi:hypothetical protein
MGHYVSFILQSWQDGADGTMRWQVRRTDDPEPLILPDSAFVIRTWIDDQQLVRGLIRHVQSGREMQFQSSERALEFVKAWLDADLSQANEWQLAPLDNGYDPADELSQQSSKPYE